MRKLICAFVIPTAILIGGTTIFGSIEAAPESSQLTLGWAPCACFEPVMVAQEKGIFKNRGLKVEYKRFPSFFPIIEALLAAKIDGGIVNSVFAVSSAARTGISMSLVYPLNFVGTFGGVTYGPQAFMVARSDSRINSLGELKGKTIGIGAFSDVGHVALIEELRREGVEANGVKFVQIPFPQMEGAIVNGEVDAGLLIYPFITFAQDRGTLKTIAANIDDVLLETIIAWLALHPDFVEREPEATRIFVESLAEAVQWMHDPENAEERYRILSKWTGIKEAAVRKMGLQTQYFGVFQTGIKDHERYLRPWNELMIKAGVVDQLVDFGKFEPRFDR